MIAVVQRKNNSQKKVIEVLMYFGWSIEQPAAADYQCGKKGIQGTEGSGQALSAKRSDAQW